MTRPLEVGEGPAWGPDPHGAQTWWAAPSGDPGLAWLAVSLCPQVTLQKSHLLLFSDICWVVTVSPGLSQLATQQ